MAKKPFRLEISDDMNNLSYLCRDNKGRITLTAKNGTPLALTYIAENGERLRFAMEDAIDATSAARVAKTYLWNGKKVSVL